MVLAGQCRSINYDGSPICLIKPSALPTVAGQVLNVGDIIAVSRVDKTGNDAQADIASDRAKAAANAVDTVWR